MSFCVHFVFIGLIGLLPLLIVLFTSLRAAYKNPAWQRRAHFADSPIPPPLEPCWFGTNHPQEKETTPRCDSFDLSNTTCCTKRLTVLETLNEFNGKPQLFEFDSPLALLLYRANAELVFDKEEAQSRMICSAHFKSLLSQWGKSKHLRTTQRGSGKSYVCSLPNSYHPGTRPKGNYSMNKAQCIRWMEQHGELIHPGIVLCLDHKKSLYSDHVDKQPSPSCETHFNNDFNNDFDGELESNDVEVKVEQGGTKNQSDSILVFLASICTLLKINRLLCNNEWSDLEAESKQKKKRAFRTLVFGLARAIAGDSYNDLLELTVLNCKCPPNSGDAFMDVIAAKYASYTNRKDKLELLSIVLSVKGYCHRQISSLMSVTKHQIRTAIAFSKGLYSIVKYKRIRYNLESVREFIRFLARHLYSEAVLSDGTKVNVASVCRLYSYSRIIKDYHAYLKEAGKFVTHFLGRTSLYLMLKNIAKRKNKQLYCVDEFLGDAHLGFDNIDSSVTRLCEMDVVTTEEKKLYKQGLRVVKSFLETGFRSHIQESSEIAAHCVAHALSDPNDENFATKCDHSHDYLCMQCEQVDSVIHTILEKAREVAEYSISSNQPINVEICRIFEVIDQSAKAIFKFRKHLLRSAASESARREIQESLDDGECLLTINFAQKLLASSAMEKQSGFYAKKGVPLHIGHALSRSGNDLRHHIFAHLIRDGDQDCDGVGAILRHTFEELERLGIKKVTIRSDNAVTFKSASVLSMLQSLALSAPLLVRYAFSETQDGKGPCDRAAAYLKRPIIAWNESKKDSVTPTQMFEAMVASPPKGCSIFLVDINPTSTKIKKNPIPGISTFFDFEFKTNGLLVRKYAGVGNGKIIPNTKLVPNLSTLTVVKSGGFLASEECWVVLRSDPSKKVTQDDDEFDLEVSSFPCSTKNCIKSFASIEDLEVHEYEQSHAFDRVKDSMLDTAIKTFATSIEAEECAKATVEQSDLIIKRSDAPTHVRGWAMKDPRAPRMDSDVQSVAEKFFLEKRAEGKSASPSECCDLIRSMMDPKTGYYRFALALCPSEKSLTSTFGNWESKRLRPKAVASRGRGRPKKTAPSTPITSTKNQKRSIDEVDYSDEEGRLDNYVTDEEEEEIVDKICDEEIINDAVNDVFDEIFYR